jgi:hypothetical protein
MFDRRMLSRLAAGAMCVAASVSVASQGRPLAITRVSVVDDVAGQIVPNSTVVVSGRTITAVLAGGAPPAGAVAVDGAGKFLIPGLWDMHAHIQVSGEAWLQLYAANGVTGIRDMGADLEFILAMRDATSSGRVLGPEVIAAGPILDDAPADWPLRMRVKNAAEGRAAVQLLKRRGVDLIKVHNYTPRDAFFAIADEARRQNLPLAGHVPLKVTVEEAVEAGITNIEHLSEDGKVWKACSVARSIGRTRVGRFSRCSRAGASGRRQPWSRCRSSQSSARLRRPSAASISRTPANNCATYGPLTRASSSRDPKLSTS